MRGQEMLTRLARLDEDAALMFESDERFHMVIVGGGALILLEHISRATHDIDVLDAPKELVGLLEKYDINCQVSAYVNNFPYNYEDRLVPLPVGGKKIDFFTASLEDIVIAKLCSDRATDRKDIESEGVVGELDWRLLAELVKEEKESALNEKNYAEFLSRYEEYVKRFKP